MRFSDVLDRWVSVSPQSPGSTICQVSTGDGVAGAEGATEAFQEPLEIQLLTLRVVLENDLEPGSSIPCVSTEHSIANV
eukprot:2320638-Rhodomonas_salina.2